MTYVSKLARWEAGELSETEAIELFQELANSGDIWELQDRYQWLAYDMMNAGLLVFPDRDYYETQ